MELMEIDDHIIQVSAIAYATRTPSGTPLLPFGEEVLPFFEADLRAHYSVLREKYTPQLGEEQAGAIALLAIIMHGSKRDAKYKEVLLQLWVEHPTLRDFFFDDQSSITSTTDNSVAPIAEIAM